MTLVTFHSQAGTISNIAWVIQPRYAGRPFYSGTDPPLHRGGKRHGHPHGTLFRSSERVLAMRRSLREFDQEVGRPQGVQRLLSSGSRSGHQHGQTRGGSAKREECAFEKRLGAVLPLGLIQIAELPYGADVMLRPERRAHLLAEPDQQFVDASPQVPGNDLHQLLLGPFRR